MLRARTHGFSNVLHQGTSCKSSATDLNYSNHGPIYTSFTSVFVQAFDAAAAEDAAAAAASSSSNERSSSSGTSKVDELVDAAVDAMSSMILGRMHGVLLGPGLGRHPAVLRVAAGVVQRLSHVVDCSVYYFGIYVLCQMSLRPLLSRWLLFSIINLSFFKRRCVGAGIPLVIDADGLYLISQQPALVAGGGNKVLLTPNPVEFKRLRDAVLPSGATAAPADCTSGDASAPLEQVSTPAPGVKTGFSGEAAAELRAVSAALGAAVLRKGKHDAIVGSEAGDGAKALLVVEGEHGSPRRSGGMGDLLAGAAVVFLTWAHRMSPPAGGHEARESSAARDALAEAPPALWAAWTACVVVKRSAAAAFAKHGRSTTAPDVLAEVGPEVGKLFPLESP